MSDNSSNENEDEQSSSSPTTSDVINSPLTANNFRTALDEFRTNWQKELKQFSETEASVQFEDTLQSNEIIECLSPLTNVKDIPENEQHNLAESLFHKAVELEQRGKVYDAIPFYRKAVQIVPDIEFKFYERQKLKSGNVEVTTKTQNVIENTEVDHDSDGEDVIADLYEKFQMDLARDCGGKLLLSSRDLNVITTEMHISDLPPEILLYILRWVISLQLDMRSLENCAAVCKGLYLCARDEELWRLACVKVWGVNVGTLNNPTLEIDDTIEDIIQLPQYSSWRQMFIERERLLFNGCYISKTKYLRMGENSFQDQFYRPVQLVEYFRYLRFLPDGTVLMLTTADEPVQGVTRLRNINQLRPDVLRGHYHLYGSTVTIMLKRQQSHQRIITTGHQYARHRRGSSACNEDYNSTKYCMKFRIVSTPKRKFSQIAWLHYSVILIRNKVETTSEFDLTPSKFPPLWFSPVRSYHLDSDAPLS
ncbi:F-box only protein 9 [Teleopsis dalmanni]|uniref:F-box only protein 9 n=1 Tax=Teleopsis dalmanni TaxID=139649 RepID=UPI0018CE5307|nr:F-box only protein 9 [Teleopsis dalmanni]